MCSFLYNIGRKKVVEITIQQKIDMPCDALEKVEQNSLDDWEHLNQFLNSV